MSKLNLTGDMLLLKSISVELFKCKSCVEPHFHTLTRWNAVPFDFAHLFVLLMLNHIRRCLIFLHRQKFSRQKQASMMSKSCHEKQCLYLYPKYDFPHLSLQIRINNVIITKLASLFKMQLMSVLGHPFAGRNE